MRRIAPLLLFAATAASAAGLGCTDATGKVGATGASSATGTGDASAAHAALPKTMTFQGRVFDLQNAPITGTLDVKFTLYDAAVAGNEVWSETLPIKFDAGYFAVDLGAVEDLAGVLDGSSRYLAV